MSTPGKVTYCLLLLSFLPALFCLGQGKPLDSLQARVPASSNQQKAALYVQIAELFSNSNLDSSYSYAQKALLLAKKYNEPIIPKAEYFIAAYYIRKGIPDSCFFLARKNMRILEKKKDDLLLLVDYSNLIGHYHMRNNRQKDALENYYYSLKIADNTGDPVSQIKANANIGWALMELNQFDKAISQFKKAIALMNAHKINRYATVYNNIASCFGEKKQFDSAKKYVQLGIQLAKSNNDLLSLANGLNILGTLHQSNNQFEEALQAFLAAKDVRITIGDPFFIVSDMAVVAGLYARIKQPEKGLTILKEALKIAEQTNLQAKLPMLYEALAANYEASGNFLLAAQAYKKINSLKDSIYAQASPKALAEMQAKYETEKKERLIQQQQFEILKKNYWITGFSCLLILGALLGYSVQRRKKLAHEKRLQEEILKQQQLASKAVMEAEEAERQRIAKDLHDGVGQMMSAAKMNLSAIETHVQWQSEEQKTAFQNVIGLVDESCKEVRSVSHNMMPNALLKNNLASALREFISKLDQQSLKVHLYIHGLDERLDSNIETVLYRIIQESVNNVIRHSGADTLNISIIKDEDEITATIEDNGKGFDTTDEEKFNGIGLKNMRTRIEYLKGSIELDSAPGRGTVVALHVPLT